MSKIASEIASEKLFDIGWIERACKLSGLPRPCNVWYKSEQF